MLKLNSDHLEIFALISVDVRAIDRCYSRWKWSDICCTFASYIDSSATHFLNKDQAIIGINLTDEEKF
jgi:hypothetical protein